MIFRLFGKTLKKVSEIGLGLSQFSETRNKNLYGYKSEKEVLSVIKYAISQKINFFDTSGGYGDTEKILGKLSKREKKNILISTKAGRKPDGTRCFQNNYLEKELDKSLKNIKTDRINLFMLNKPKIQEIEKENLLYFFEKLKKKEKFNSVELLLVMKLIFLKLSKDMKLIHSQFYLI